MPFFVREMHDNFRVNAILALLILEKASDMVPREVINWAMCKLGVGEVAEKGCQAWKLNK